MKKQISLGIILVLAVLTVVVSLLTTLIASNIMAQGNKNETVNVNNTVGSESEIINTEYESDSYKNTEMRLYDEIDIVEGSNTLKIGDRFREALYGNYNMLTFPSIKQVSYVDTLVDESGKTVESSYAYMENRPFSSNYIAYEFDLVENLEATTKYTLAKDGRDLLSSYEDDILEVSKDISEDIEIQDCYMGYPIFMKNTEGLYGYSFSISAVYEKDGVKNIGLIGFITDSGFTQVEKNSLEMFNSTNRILGDTEYAGMKEWRLTLETEANILYLENMSRHTGNNVLYTDITYPLCGSTSDSLE